MYSEAYDAEEAPPPPTPTEPTTVASEVALVQFTEEDEQCIAERASLKKYTDWNCKRNEERAKLEVEAEETWEFRVGESLRLEWISAQKRDPDCIKIFRDLRTFSLRPHPLPPTYLRLAVLSFFF